MAEVKMEDVTKVFGEDVVAVQDMNLDVPEGEFVVFVGPSGCGKSTALRMVAGLEDVTQGRIFIGDEVVNDKPPRERDVAMVFQNYALYPHMNVRDNLSFALKQRKMDEGEIDRRVGEAARILGIERFLDRKPRALSGGQMQRVACSPKTDPATMRVQSSQKGREGGLSMGKKHSSEQIVRMLRQAEANLAAGATVAEAARELGMVGTVTVEGG
jgi:ABC-type polar amino acid transport system ATPase subunit